MNSVIAFVLVLAGILIKINQSAFTEHNKLVGFCESGFYIYLSQ